MAQVDLSRHSTQLIRDLIRTAENAVNIYEFARKKCESCGNRSETQYYADMKHSANLRLHAYRQELIRRGE